MEIFVEKVDLEKALYQAQGIAVKRSTMPILSNVLLRAADNKLFISATDLEIGLSTECNAKVTEVGSVAVNAKHLYEIVCALPKKANISIKDGKNFSVKLRSGASEYKLLGISADDFTQVPEVDSSKMFPFTCSVLKEMIEKSAYAVSNDASRYNLNGCFLQRFDNNLFRIAATDGNRMALLESKLGASTEPINLDRERFFDHGAILPTKGLDEIVRVIDSEKKEDGLLGLDGSSILVQVGSATLILRLLDSTYPDFVQYIPQNQSVSLVLGKEELASSMKRIQAIQAVNNEVLLTLGQNVLVVSGSNPDTGEAKDEIPVKWEGKEFGVGVNSKFVVDALDSIDTEQVTLHMENDSDPIVINPDPDCRLTCIIMPMRLT